MEPSMDVSSCSRRVLVLFALACGCADEPLQSTTTSEINPGGIEGANCSGASPVMSAADGTPYVFQSLVSYFYHPDVLQAHWADLSDGKRVLQMSVPPDEIGVAFYEWMAKAIQIDQSSDGIGYTARYYDGVFDFLAGRDPGGQCVEALDDESRVATALGQVALSNAFQCGLNDDMTPKFWKVKRLLLFFIGQVIDAARFVAKGVAEDVGGAPSSRCLLPMWPYVETGPFPIPCRIAWVEGLVVEGVAFAVDSDDVVEETSVDFRVFTAAGFEPLPNGLDEARTIERSDDLRTMYAFELPISMAEPEAGPTHVRITGMQIGPQEVDNELLRPEELTQVREIAGDYHERCCRMVCTRDTTDTKTAKTGSGSGSGTCEEVCTPQRQCRTGRLYTGLITAASPHTTKVCERNCPAPTEQPPSEAPICTR
jgi:hypothetical protein